MKRIFLRVAYDGTDFVGWQIQNEGRTVEGELNKAINELSNGEYPIANNNGLFNADTKELYNVDTLLMNTNIRNGTRLILLSGK